MRIAVTYENGRVFQHFGHTESFKLYDVEDGRVVDTSVIDTDGQGHGALSELLARLGAKVLICGGIGGGAKSALGAAGIEIFGGVSGSCDEAVEAFLAQSLSYDPNVRCSHHDDEHGDKEHTCGDHGCGKGSCGSHGCH